MLCRACILAGVLDRADPGHAEIVQLNIRDLPFGRPTVTTGNTPVGEQYDVAAVTAGRLGWPIRPACLNGVGLLDILIVSLGHGTSPWSGLGAAGCW